MQGRDKPQSLTKRLGTEPPRDSPIKQRTDAGNADIPPAWSLLIYVVGIRLESFNLAIFFPGYKYMYLYVWICEDQ